MRSLFLKIFLWFWLATVLVVGVQVVATLPPPPDGHPARVVVGPMLRAYGLGALRALDRDGPAGLNAELNRMRDGGILLYLMDDRGRELSDAATPPAAGELAEQVRTSQAIDFRMIDGGMLVASPLKDAAGRDYVVVGQMPLNPMEQALGRSGTVIPRIALTVLTAGGLCYALARYITAPLRRLRDAATRLAGGELEARAGPAVRGRRDEIGDLGRDFDHMAERVSTLIDAQRRLLRDISHELRSPLARIMVALELARQRCGPDAAGALAHIERDTDRMSALISHLLTLARLESGVEADDQTRMDLAQLVRQVADDADFEARGRGRRVSVTAVERAIVNGSPELLRRALENVVRNAVTHTAEGTVVEVSLRGSSGAGDAGMVAGDDATAVRHAGITVRDRGPGVPESALGDIFRPFHRLADARERRTGGAGLGLSITLRAVQFHGGTVRAANAADGGLLVEITFPTVGDAGCDAE